MMEYGLPDTPGDKTRYAVKQAILLNEHLLRRAWGVLYIALSLSMLLSIFGTPIIDSIESLGVANSIGLNMTGSGFGVIAILWAFKRVRNAAETIHPEGDRAWSTPLGYRFIVAMWVAANAVAILTLVLARALVPSMVLLLHLAVAAYLLYALRLSFSRKIPEEAVIAIGSLSLSSIASLALLPFVSSTGPYAVIWGATIAVWIFSGVYARTRPIPEIEEEPTGLE
ncbi:MAG: hypothetical protein JRN51_10935 [Nitrososphaerota archaeon]|jgi:hypothetical protein|nr:hypothetical protein [Nitrososphaerota archaeon]MDG6981609.1 hypothetical protein [Nitrososphaerota archaeon]